MSTTPPPELPKRDSGAWPMVVLAALALAATVAILVFVDRDDPRGAALVVILTGAIGTLYQQARTERKVRESGDLVRRMVARMPRNSRGAGYDRGQ